jgi:CheY-like chemotaxis protein/HD-like signal output (HDOD) protein
MPKILFVDDDANILNGLQRMLRPMRNAWEIAFADNGLEALAILNCEPFDIIVTDMRMPSMNGAELLSEVLRIHPQIVRIILSGQADLNNALAGIGLAHRYLSKPTEPATLMAVLRRALGLATLVPDPTLRRMLNSLQSLPSASLAYSGLMDLVRAPGCDAGSLAGIVAFDMGLAAKTLQIAGSAFVNSPCRTANAWRAVQMLGSDLMRSLALNTSVFTDLSTMDERIDRSAIAELLGTSSARARRLSAVITDPDLAAEAAAFELLRDVGKAALAVALGAEYSEIHGSSPDDRTFLSRADSDCMGACHSKVGSYLMGLWGLPETLSEAIAKEQGALDPFPLLNGIEQRSGVRRDFAGSPR